MANLFFDRSWDVAATPMGQATMKSGEQLTPNRALVSAMMRMALDAMPSVVKFGELFAKRLGLMLLTIFALNLFCCK